MKALAAALADDPEVLAALAADSSSADLARAHRLGPALALRARRLEVDGPAVASWHRDLLGSAAHRLHIADRLAVLASALGDAGLPWVPIKGCDLGDRVYERPEERPVGDIDLLVARADFPRVREALGRAGWQGLADGERIERYLRQEGYAWQAADSTGLLLEIHLRLWGIVPAGMTAAFLAAAVPDPALGPTARRLPLAYAWLLAAVHSWLNPRPRPLLALWDLDRIAAAEPALVDQAVSLADAWDLQLPAGLAAARAAELWGAPAHREIAARLLGRLRGPERLAARRARERGTDRLPLEAIVLARLLARRASRAGWRSLPRRVWAHPGVVEQETPSGRSWPARRIAHVLRALRRT